MTANHNKFICPECGSEKVKNNFHYKNKSGDGLYSKVVHEFQCGSCFMDIPGHLGERLENISFDEAKNEWVKKYRPEHLKEAAKCSICLLYYYEIEKKLLSNMDNDLNIFMQKFTQTGSPDLICRICEPNSFE